MVSDLGLQAWYLGCVPNVSIANFATAGSGNSSSGGLAEENSMVTIRSADVQLIDRIENAQLDGRLPMTVENEPKIRLHLSRHGVKMVDPETLDVLERYPLHTVAQAISYDDGYGRFNVALKVGQTGKNQFSCHVFQTSSEREAESVCTTLREIFSQVVRSQSPSNNSSTTNNGGHS